MCCFSVLGGKEADSQQVLQSPFPLRAMKCRLFKKCSERVFPLSPRPLHPAPTIQARLVNRVQAEREPLR